MMVNLIMQCELAKNGSCKKKMLEKCSKKMVLRNPNTP